MSMETHSIEVNNLGSEEASGESWRGTLTHSVLCETSFGWSTLNHYDDI